MKVEFYRPVDGIDALLVATATWDGRGATVESDDESVAGALARAFRKTPVVTDDPSYRRAGATGEVALPPGDLEWFRTVAYVRVAAETGLQARVVTGEIRTGYDPASDSRRFEEQIERLAGS